MPALRVYSATGVSWLGLGVEGGGCGYQIGARATPTRRADCGSLRHIPSQSTLTLTPWQPSLNSITQCTPIAHDQLDINPISSSKIWLFSFLLNIILFNWNYYFKNMAVIHYDKRDLFISFMNSYQFFFFFKLKNSISFVKVSAHFQIENGLI